MRQYIIQCITHVTFVTLFLGLAYSAYADEILKPTQFDGHYEFAFSGIPFGMLNLSYDQEANRYDMRAEVALTGLVKLFVKHESHTTSQGTGANFNYPNSVYESSYATRNKPKYVKFIRTNGTITTETIKPPDNRATRPAVPAALKNDAYDPLLIGLAIRKALAESIHTGDTQFSLSYFDGRRLTKGDFRVVGEENLRIHGTVYPVYHLTARRTPVAGHTQKELSRITPNEPELSLYFSHDERLVPIRMEIPFTFGTIAATLRK